MYIENNLKYVKNIKEFNILFIFLCIMVWVRNYLEI